MMQKWIPKVERAAKILAGLDNVIVEYDDIKRQILLLLLADGHGLLESMPGLGKTMLVSALQWLIDGTVSARIQMTPDLKPNDVVGFEVFNPKTGEFVTRKGPLIGAGLVLADEVNRTTPKTNSAMLQAMQERVVTIGNETHALEEMFLVLATINPVEQEGTYPLPEAMLDRFAFKLRMGYISEAGEIEMARRTAVHGRNARLLVEPVVTVADILEMRADVARIADTISDSALRYIVQLVRSTRPGDSHFDALSRRARAAQKPALDEMVEFGASPRAIIWTLHTAAALAYLNGRDRITPDDVKAVFGDVVRHRIVMKQMAELDGFTSDDVIAIALDPSYGVPVIDAAAK